MESAGFKSMACLIVNTNVISAFEKTALGKTKRNKTKAIAQLFASHANAKIFDT